MYRKIVVLLLCARVCCPTAFSQRQVLKPTLGIAAGIEQDSVLSAAGCGCIIESIGRRLSPRQVTEADFQLFRARMRKSPMPVCAFNLFIPGELKVVGPAVDEKAVLNYVETVMARVAQTNTRMIVWGSGGSRRIPEGFDRRVAEKQFVHIAKKIARIARKYDITIALENLNSTETNFINTVAEALAIVRKVHHTNLRLNADIYHMLKEGESPAILAATKRYLAHVEIAEKEKRTPPGTTGEDFRPYLRALSALDYHRNIVIEGQWDNLPATAARALSYLQKQVDEAYEGH